MKLNITGSKNASVRDLLDISQEALKEIMLTDLGVGAANGSSVHVRYELMGTPRWFKVYIFRIGLENLFIDAREIEDNDLDLFCYAPKEETEHDEPVQRLL